MVSSGQEMGRADESGIPCRSAARPRRQPGARDGSGDRGQPDRLGHTGRHRQPGRPDPGNERSPPEYVSSLDVAYLTRDIAATSPTLTAPARQIAMRAQGEAEIAADHGNTAYQGMTWATERQIAANQLIPLPTPARLGLIKATDHLIASCNSAVGAAATLDASESGQVRERVRAPAIRRTQQAPKMAQQ